MSMDDNDGQMIFGDLGGLKLPDICLTGEKKPRKNVTQENFPDQGSNLGPLREKHACYHLLHSGGRQHRRQTGRQDMLQSYDTLVWTWLKRENISDKHIKVQLSGFILKEKWQVNILLL